MRKIGLLATLTVVGMLSFASVAMAADGTPTDPAVQGSANNGTGYNTLGKTTTDLNGNTVDFSGQSYRMDTFGNAGPAGSPQTGGTNGTGFTSPVPTSADIKYDSSTNLKIHSSYSKTSDACASCHTIHNSVNSGALLQWEDPQTACWACHDGTVAATYNVVTGTHTDGTATQVNSAGLFGIGNEAGLSNHGMSVKEPAFVTTAAAPGGAETALSTVQKTNKDGSLMFDAAGLPVYEENTDKNGNWNTEFSCIACHDPHGTFGNARILNPNVNDIAFENQVKGETLTVVTAGTVYQTKKPLVYNSHELPFTLYDSSLVGALDPSKTDGTKLTTGIVNSQLYTLDSMTGTVTLKYTTTGTLTADYFAGLQVKMDVQGKLTTAETVKYQSGINQFCGACHTDYNNVNKVPVWKTTDNLDTSIKGNNGISTGIQATNADGTLKFTTGGAYKQALGEYRVAYRHSVGFTRTTSLSDLAFTDANSLDALYPGLKFDTSNPKAPTVVAPTVDCLTCHFAHGTSDQFITDSLTSLGQIGAFPAGSIKTVDASRTTALKRLPNMGVCQACHNKQ